MIIINGGEIFDYDGLNLIWKKSPKYDIDAGSIAGTLNNYGYIQVKYKGKLYKAHRIIWEMYNGTIPEKIQIDRIDGNKSNNALDNLRLATHQENQRNQGAKAHNTSGYKGVSWNKRDGKWVAKYRLNSRTIHIGYYDTVNEASEAYIRITTELHGDFMFKSL